MRHSEFTLARVLTLVSLVLALAGYAVGSASHAASATAASTVIPPLPAPIPVSLDAKTSALLLLDMTAAFCKTDPDCVATIPAASALLKKARDAKATVVFTAVKNPADIVLPELAPQPDEPVFHSQANKFDNTSLDDTLKAKGVKTVVLLGTAANGAVLYTSYEANTRGYASVIATDAISVDETFLPDAWRSAKHLVLMFSELQYLSQPGHHNVRNEFGHLNIGLPTATLSRSALITFK